MSNSFRHCASAGLLFALLGAASGGAAESAALDQAAPAAQPPADSSAPPPAEPPAAQDQEPPVFRTGVNFVRVDVIVTDREGNPVMDLTAEDFQVVEDDEQQMIETFELIELDGGLIQGPDGPPRQIRTDYDQEMEAARPDVRLFAIFLDDYHVGRNAGVRAREQLARFVETQLGPSDMIGLMYPLEPAAGVVFTRDHAAVTRAIRQFDGRKGDYEPRNSIEQEYVYRYPTEMVERIRNDVSLSALQALMVRLGSLKEGRKSLILFSEGYTHMVPPQLRSRQAGIPDPDNPARFDPDAGVDSLDEMRAMNNATFDIAMTLREVAGIANRNNVAIYGVDPRGLAASEFDASQNISARTDRDYLNATMDTIRRLSDDTTGRAFVNRNDLTVAMRQVLRDASAYYLLGYTSTVGQPDGEFHELSVRTRRPGLQVRARAGYWALKPEEAERVTTTAPAGPPPAVAKALSAIGQPTRGRIVTTWIGSARGDAGDTRVTLVWEPVAATPGSPTPARNVPASVTIMAAGTDGTPYYRGPVSATDPRVSFDARPGEVELVLSIRDADGEVLDSETRTVTVPDLAGTSFGTPMFFRARTARMLQDLKANPAALPTTAHEFSRNERLLIRVAAYAADGAPTVSARLLNRMGDAMSNLAVEKEPTGMLAVEVPLATLAPGDYLLEFAATASSGDATELVGFRVD